MMHMLSLDPDVESRSSTSGKRSESSSSKTSSGGSESSVGEVLDTGGREYLLCLTCFGGLEGLFLGLAP